MGVRIEFTRDFRRHKLGEVTDQYQLGVADALVNYRKCARFVDPKDDPRLQRLGLVQTMVPAVPGLSQLVDVVTGRKNRKAVG